MSVILRYIKQWRTQEKCRWFQDDGRRRWGSGEFAGEFAKICKRFLRKLQKIHDFSLFFKKFQDYALKICSFGRKTQLVGKFWEYLENLWWKFNRKIEFLFISGKVVAKNRAFRNNIIFLQQFSLVRGEGVNTTDIQV